MVVVIEIEIKEINHLLKARIKLLQRDHNPKVIKKEHQVEDKLQNLQIRDLSKETHHQRELKDEVTKKRRKEEFLERNLLSPEDSPPQLLSIKVHKTKKEMIHLI